MDTGRGRLHECSIDPATVILAFVSGLHAATTKLKFENIVGNYEFGGFKIAERWWFESQSKTIKFSFHGRLNKRFSLPFY